MVYDERNTIEQILTLFAWGQVRECVKEGLGEALFGLDALGTLVLIKHILKYEKIEAGLHGKLYVLLQLKVPL